MPVPHDHPTFDQIMHALRSSGESGDILCLHAAEEIDRLRLQLAAAEKRASEAESEARLLLLENLRGVFAAPQ